MEESKMKTLTVFLVGFIIGTIGLTGTVKIVEKGFDQLQTVAKDASQ